MVKAKPWSKQLDDVAAFARDFRFKDNGIGLDFAQKEQLTKFFRKARELYPDYFVRTDQAFVSGEDMIIQWTLQFTITEPFYGGLTRRLPISISGVSIVRMRPLAFQRRRSVGRSPGACEQPQPGALCIDRGKPSQEIFG